MIYQISDTGATFLVTTHYMDEAEQFSRLLFMNQGKLIAEGAPERIKREHFDNALWRVECDKPALSARVLHDQDFVLDVSLPGNVLHVTTAKSDSATELIKQSLQAAGIIVQTITRTNPTLEDVFVSLTTNGNSNSQDAG